MGHVAFRTLRPRIMFSDHDCFVPFRPPGSRVMAAQAGCKRALVDILLLRVVAVHLAGTVATFASQGFMLVFGQLQHLVRMAFVAGLLAGEYAVALLQFRQGLPT